MQTSELYINDERVELSDSSPIAITMQVNNLADIKDRQSTYTNSIKIPITQRNKEIFGYADSDSFTQNQPYQNLKAKLVQNGVEVIPQGQGNLQTVSDFFETQITYGLSGFVDIIGNYKLADLDWSFIPNFIWSLPVVVNAMNGIGQPWPVIDYGNNVDGGAQVDITKLRPAVFASQILFAIQNYSQYIKPSEPNNRYSGYTFQGAILSNTTFLNEIIPCSNNKNFFAYTGLEAVPGDTISIAKNLPDFTISDWLKDFMQRYFLTPVVDNLAQTITFMSFDDLYTNKATARNWTKKFVRDARTDQFIFGSYGQVNKFTWEKDDVFLNSGDGQIDILNNSLPQSVDAIKSIFSNTDLSPFIFAGSFQIAKIVTVNGIGDKIDTTPRVLTLRSGTGIFDLTDGVSHTFNNFIKYGYFGTQFDLGIGWPGQIQNFGTGFIKLVERVRVITRYVLLTPLDVADFDFFTPVYDEFEAKYYYVNSIVNFIPGVKTKVQIIRM